MAKTMLDVMYEDKIRSQMHRFGPDYYARQASSPSGGKLKTAESKDLVWPPAESKEEESTLHKAVPAIVNSDDVYYASTSPEVQPQVVQVVEPAVSEVTSDSDLSCVNFYDVENSQVYKKSKDGDEVILLEAKALPEETPSDLNNNEKGKLSSAASEDEIEIVVPKIRERKIISRSKVENKPDYVKATPLIRQRTVPAPSSTKYMKRHKSETDLLDDTFDKPPTIISRKKDNTLISKIYLDPQVRSFALSREHVSMENAAAKAKPPLRNQLSVDANVFALAIEGERVNNSDDVDGLSNRSLNKAYYSSEEDLLDFGNKEEVSNASVRNQRVKTSRQSLSSEDGLLSDHGSVSLDKPQRLKSTRSLIYSSNEDLLSIEEPEILPKKKDNTLISRIYQDPNVRNFGLTNRDYIPVSEEELSRPLRKTFSSEEDLLVDPRVKNNSFSFDMNVDGFQIDEITSAPAPKEEEREIASPDPGIDELAKKKIVHNLLGKMWQSQPSLGEKKESRERKLSIDAEEVTVSVKDLKKRFENNDVKSRVVSSLTARSLSKQMRENLKN